MVLGYDPPVLKFILKDFKKMMNVEQIRIAMRDRKLPIVATAVGIEQGRLWRIMTCRASFLRESELIALSEYLGATPRHATTTK